jgi:hypothetical protein
MKTDLAIQLRYAALGTNRCVRDRRLVVNGISRVILQNACTASLQGLKFEFRVAALVFFTSLITRFMMKRIHHGDLA